MKIDTSKTWIPERFTLVSNTDLGEIDTKDIGLYLSDKQKEGSIGGEELLKEVPKPLSSAVLRHLLDNPKEIPEEWKNKDVYFFGTVIQSLYGNRCVLSLYWRDEWDWSCEWLKSNPSAVLASNVPESSFDPLLLKFEYKGKKYKIIEG